MSLMAAASTIFWMMNFLMALSLSTQVQRIGCMRLWPFWAPLFRLFLVILEVQRQEPFAIYWHSLNQILMKPFWPLANFGMLQRARVCVCVCVCVLVAQSCLILSPWTVACQAPLPMEFSRQEYWSELPFTSPRDLPDSEVEPRSPALQQILYHLSQQGSPQRACRTSRRERLN